VPSQQAGWSQQLKTVAAWADNERNRTATTANTLNFNMVISFFGALRDIAYLDVFGMLLTRKGRLSLNAKVVFKSKYSALIPETRS
jgi:hypothetical protein